MSAPFFLFYNEKLLEEYCMTNHINWYVAFSQLGALKSSRDGGDLVEYLSVPNKVIMPDFIQNPDAIEILRIIATVMIENGINLHMLAEYVRLNFGDVVYYDIINEQLLVKTKPWSMTP